jgi:hypothetical protein
LTVKNPACFVSEKIDLEDGSYPIEAYYSSFDLSGEQEMYLIYKDDLNFRTTPSTKFGDVQILQAREGGHIAYNHRSISLWAENVHLQGYYRESTQGEGKSLGYNIVNSSGFDDEFSKKEITTDKPMPERITALLDSLK